MAILKKKTIKKEEEVVETKPEEVVETKPEESVEVNQPELFRGSEIISKEDVVLNDKKYIKITTIKETAMFSEGEEII